MRKLIIFLSCLALLACAAQAQASEMKNLELKVCSQEQTLCLKLKAPSAQVANHSLSFSFAQAEIEVQSANSAKPRLILIHNGVWDAKNNWLVGEEIQGHQRTEILWDLNTLKIIRAH